MKTLSLSLPGHVLGFFGRNPFHQSRPRPASFIKPPPPPDPLRPVALAQTGVAGEDQGESPTWIQRIESVAVFFVKKVFVATFLLCVFGAQHIADTRKIVQSANQQRQAELATQAITRAYRQLQYQAAIQPAPQTWPLVAHLPRPAPRAPPTPTSAHPLLARRIQPVRVAPQPLPAIHTRHGNA